VCSRGHVTTDGAGDGERGRGMAKLGAIVFGMLALFVVATGGELDHIGRYRPAVVRREGGASW